MLTKVSIWRAPYLVASETRDVMFWQRLLLIAQRSHALRPTWHGEDWLCFGISRREDDGGLAVANLQRRQTIADILTFFVEADRAANHHPIGNVGRAQRLNERLGIGRARTLIGVGGDQGRLEREADINIEGIIGKRLGKGRIDRLGKGLIGVHPRIVREAVFGIFAQRLDKRTLIETRRTWA